MKAAEYIIDFLKEQGVTHIYEVIGGMITHLLDAAHQKGGLSIISMHHEQSAAFAVEAAGQISGYPLVAMATSGPGAINLLTGIAGCYFDSVPAVFITGQVNTHELRGNRKLRQLGFQETDIVSMATPITKWAIQIEDAADIPRTLVKAFSIAQSGRPGPVLIDIPMNLQRMDIQVPETQLTLAEEGHASSQSEWAPNEIASLLSNARRPLVLVGGGASGSKIRRQTREFLEQLNFPVVHSLLGVDILAYDHPLRVGMIGSYGNRWANKALGESDVLVVLGSRLDIRQTGADVASFASGKVIIHVNNDHSEINDRVKGCKPVVCELNIFYQEMKKVLHVDGAGLRGDASDWKSRISDLKRTYPDVSELRGVRGINPNVFMHDLSRSSTESGGYFVDVGNHQMWAAQSLELTESQRFVTSGGLGAMGFSLPGAIGGCFSLGHRPVVQICGDGGMQMNMQELETVAHHGLPIKMVVLNNRSLGMVRQFQQSYFDNRNGSTRVGYSAPDFECVAKAFGIESHTVSEGGRALENALGLLWKDPERPFLLQVMIDPDVNVYPKIAFGRPLTDMEPDVKPLEMEGT
jgi:acetolactate synthase-1/2/3 large subunit